MRQILWALVLGGVWIAISPWVLGFASANLGRWSNVLAGGLIAIGGLALVTRKET